MSKERNELKAGIFIVLTVVLILAITAGIKGLASLFDPVQRQQVRFKLTDDIGGLRVGDEVRLGGFKVGVVKSIEVQQATERVSASGVRSGTATTTSATQPGASTMPATAALAAIAPAKGSYLVVSFAMPARYTLHTNARIGVQVPLTAPATLNIEDLGSGDQLAEGNPLEGQPSPLTALMASLGQAAPQFPIIANDVRGVIADVRSQTVPKVNTTVTTFNEAGGHIRDLFGDTKTDFRTTVANLKDTTGTLKESLPSAMSKADKLLGQLNETLDNTKGTLEDLKASVVNVREITASGKTLIVNNKGKLDAMIASLKIAGDNLKAATSEIRRSPWRLLYKPGPGEVANLNLYDTARQFAEGAGSLNEAATALRDAASNKDTPPEKIEELIHRLDKSFTNFQSVEDELWRSVKE